MKLHEQMAAIVVKLVSSANICVLTERVQLQGFVAERKGEREEMQDAHVIIDDFSTFVNSDTE